MIIKGETVDPGLTDPATASSTEHSITIALTRARIDPATRDYLARRTAEGKTMREAKRCLKRFIARQLFRLLQQPDPAEPRLRTT